MTVGHERAGGKKLAPEQVSAIAEAIAAGERHSVLAERFGVSVETVGAIKSGKRWASAIDADVRARMQAPAPGGVLDATSARQVMASLEVGRPGRAIAEEFGISASMVSAIKLGKAWAHLDPDLPARLAEKPRRGHVLSEPQVVAIRELLRTGSSHRQVAEEFGVSRSTVQAISQGKTWAEAQGDPSA